MLINSLKVFFRKIQNNSGTIWKLLITGLNVFLLCIFLKIYNESLEKDENRGAITLPYAVSYKAAASTAEQTSSQSSTSSTASIITVERSATISSSPSETKNISVVVNTKPIYLEQGWTASDSLWFYSTTQGSDLLPYDFFMALEQADSETQFFDNYNIDKYRYLPQKPSISNPDGLPVGFVKDTYQGKSFIGFTCAACHTSQIDFKNIAIRIDGGPAMADITYLLTALEKSLNATINNEKKLARFTKKVADRKEDYLTQQAVAVDLKKYADKLNFDGLVNHSHIEYGYGRLDLYGRTYNKVLQYAISKERLDFILATLTDASSQRILTDQQAALVLDSINDTTISDAQFVLIMKRLASKDGSYPGLGMRDLLRFRNAMFNEADAPVSYPNLWNSSNNDNIHSNGIASKIPGRNVAEVIGTFATLDWKINESRSKLIKSLDISTATKNNFYFTSSIDLANLSRLEARVQKLKSPRWPQEILGSIAKDKAQRGERIYISYCEACHSRVNTQDWAQVIPTKMISIDRVGTDTASALNIRKYAGQSSNFQGRYLVNNVAINIEETSSLQNLLAVIVYFSMATPDADKYAPQKLFDWAFALFEPPKVKMGVYNDHDEDEKLVSYAAGPLNGVWATAPYLHNGSVPNLYSLLLPKMRQGDPESGEYRPDDFCIGNRQFDVEKVGFIADACDLSSPSDKTFRTDQLGNYNTGHEYSTGRDGKEGLTVSERIDLLEYLKTL